MVNARTDVKGPSNRLFYGDNLDIMRRYLKDEKVDFVYLDPPFNSQQDYNVLFQERDGSRSASQILAFEDTWHWNQESERTYHMMVETGGRLADALQAFRAYLGETDMMAYISMMAPRLVELRRVMKRSASLILHCDPTSSHYLKILLDSIFGPENFRNEIIWQRTTAKALMTRNLPTNHDVLLCYSKCGERKWHSDAAFAPYDLDNLDTKTLSKYTQVDENGRLYHLDNLTNPNQDRPNLTYDFLGVRRVWRWTRERMQAAYEAGLVVQPRPGAVPRLKRYLDEQRGKPLGDVWTDIPPLNSQARERLGYPTQKPEALLERLLALCTDSGDVVLDPFCGCGTAVAVAQKMERRWVGIDITHLAFNLIKYRLSDAFGADVRYEVKGEPVSLPDAERLAEEDRYQFQLWALGKVHARPAELKKGADRGIDGRLLFHTDGRRTHQIIFSVKSGKLKGHELRDLRGAVDREKADIGVLITLQAPSKKMQIEADAGGFFKSPWSAHPRLQILTVAQLLAGKQVNMPPRRQVDATFRKAPRVTRKGYKAGKLFG